MPDDIEKLRLELESKRVDNEHRAKLKELRLRERELDAAQSRANLETKGVTTPRATVYAAVATLIGGVAGAIITGAYSKQTSLGVESEKGSAAIQLERTKLQKELILKAIDRSEQSEAVKALQFFAKSGLIPDYEEKVLALATENDGAAVPALGSDHDILRPGASRWGVKTGTDPDAALVEPISKAKQITVEELTNLPRPADMMPPTNEFSAYQNKRAPPIETSIYSVEARIIAVGLEVSGDVHLILQGNTGQTMIAASPYPDDAFVGRSSRWKREIAEARQLLEKRFAPSRRFEKMSPVLARVLGVGFFERMHGATGEAPNGIQLHPVVGISFIQ